MWRFQRPLMRKRPCRILFAGPHFHAGLPFMKDRIDERNLRQKFELVHCPTTDDICREAPTVDVAIPFMEKFNANFIRAANELRLIIQYGVGLEGVDLETATELGIAVSNVPACQTGNAQATSEHAIYLTTCLLRYSYDYQRRFQSRQLGGLPIPRSLYGKRVTVVGYGAVGSVLCDNYLLPMGAQVTAVRRKWPTDTNDAINEPSFPTSTGKIIKQSTILDNELPTTDVLILACTMTPETFHLVNETTISKLPKGALIVNVGRGPLVSYDAMLPALESGHIGGFASDVGISSSHPDKPSAEPWDPMDPICSIPNVIFTPHVGGYTDYTYDKMSHFIMDAIQKVIMEEKPPPIWVNKPNN